MMIHLVLMMIQVVSKQAHHQVKVPEEDSQIKIQLTLIMEMIQMLNKTLKLLRQRRNL